MVETWFAGAGLVVCAALLLRQALPLARRERLDSRARDAWHDLRNLAQRLGHLRRTRVVKRQAHDVIERARRQSLNRKSGKAGSGGSGDNVKNGADTSRGERRPDVDRDGNVYRPDSFKPRPPPGQDKLH
ncbi:MAG: hypothetical protein H7Z19_05060 [Chitinophagaceae bacterium]|nr:hypothetical protein [Rubrivivax sp.]